MGKARSLFQNAAIYTASNLLNAAIPFVLLPILTRVLPPAGYGVIGMFQASLGVLSAFTGLSVNGAVGVRYVDRDSIDFPGYVYSCLWILALSTLATFLVVAGLHAPLAALSSVPAFWLLMAVLVSGCNFLIQIRMNIWLMSGSARAYGTFQVLLSALNMGISLLLVLYLKQGHEGRLWGQSLAVIGFAVLAVVSLVRGGWLAPRLDRGHLRHALHFGVPLIPHIIGGLLLGFADRFVINQKLGLEQAGIYLVAVQLGAGMAIVAESFNNSFVPWLFRTLKEGDPAQKLVVVRGTWLYFLAALGAAGLVALLAGPVLSLVAGTRYLPAAGALSLLALGQAFSGMYLMVTNYIFYSGKTRPLALVTALAGGLGLTLTWHLVPLMGIAGAGFSFAVAMLFRFLGTWFLAQRACPMPWFTFWKARPEAALSNTGAVDGSDPSGSTW